MQIAPIGLDRRPAGKVDGDVVPAAAAPAASNATSSAKPLRQTRGADRPSHGETASAQQALNYVENLATHLQSLKASLARQIAAPHHTEPNLADDLRKVADAWSQRPQASGGALDSQLRYTGTAGARQQFTVRGLDAAALASHDRETLSFATAGPGKPLTSVTLTPGSTPKENAQKLDRAFVSSGVRVRLGTDGTPVFDVAESAWPAVRDGLSAKGGGFRLPAGQLHKVRAQPKADAVNPDAWQAETASARRTLQEVTQALDRTRQVAAKLRQVLADAAVPVPPTEQAWAQTFAGEFSAVAGQSDYRVQSSLAPALLGLNRSRVISLLSLG